MPVGFVAATAAGLVLSGSPSADPGASLEQLKAEAQKIVGDGGEVCDVAHVRSSLVKDLFIASIDYSGRRFCNTVLVLRPRASKPIAQLGVWELDEASTAVRDLNGDGEDEIVLWDAISSYQGGWTCVSATPRIYRCSTRSCRDISHQFPAYLRETMAKEERQLAENPSDNSSPCLRLDIARLRRRLGLGADAELALAREWMKDADDSLRQRALDILGGLDSPASNNLIALMLQDPERLLANRAKQMLANRKRRTAP